MEREWFERAARGLTAGSRRSHLRHRRPFREIWPGTTMHAAR